MEPKYHRCILKISGESLAGSAGFGLDQPTIDDIAAQVAEISQLGVELAIVVGGGNADVILMAKKVDGVYDADPVTHPEARRFAHLTYSDVLNRELQVMDSTAASLCRDNHIPLVVFNIMEKGNMMRAVLGEDIGTTLD